MLSQTLSTKAYFRCRSLLLRNTQVWKIGTSRHDESSDFLTFQWKFGEYQCPKLISCERRERALAHHEQQSMSSNVMNLWCCCINESRVGLQAWQLIQNRAIGPIILKFWSQCDAVCEGILISISRTQIRLAQIYISKFRIFPAWTLAIFLNILNSITVYSIQICQHSLLDDSYFQGYLSKVRADFVCNLLNCLSNCSVLTQEYEI